MSDFWDADLGVRLDAARQARSEQQRGRLFEDLICRLFESIVGISVVDRNVFTAGRSQEVDILIAHNARRSEISFLPNFVLIECKNWSWPVSSMEVAWFDRKVKQRGIELGILVATQGVTGEQRERTFAHEIIAWALAERRRLIVITSTDLAQLSSGDDLVDLIWAKLGVLHGGGMSLPN
jgi:hypothetical protein